MSVSEDVKPRLCPQAEAALERLRVGLTALHEDALLLSRILPDDGIWRWDAGCLRLDLYTASQRVVGWQRRQS